jgi:hypothetical protein
MLGAVITVLGGFALLVWHSYRTGARRYAELVEIQQKERNQLDAS